MTNQEILQVALQQSAYDCNCNAEYFLPDMNELKEIPCEYELKVLYPDDFKDCYTKEWSNALCEDRKHLNKPAWVELTARDAEFVDKMNM